MACALLASTLLLFRPSAGQAEASCDLYASPNGSDSAAGTLSAPLLSAQRLADSLSSGQVGCFTAGTYDFDEQIKVTRADITLTSAPGTRATIVGRWWIAQGADNVTISHLNLDGRNAAEKAGPSVHAVHTVFDDVDVTNQHTNICFILGSYDYGPAIETVIENSRIHDCGELPSHNQDHGIYVEASQGVVIRDNWIYDNTDRGIQLYPNAMGTHIYGNVIDGNGEGVTFSGDGEEASSGNVVENNVISNSSIRWNVESHWTGTIGSGNILRNNCLWTNNRERYYNQNGGVVPVDEGGFGFVERDNLVANPQFVDRGDKDFTLKPGSPCALERTGSEEIRVTLTPDQRVVADTSPPVLLTGRAPMKGGTVTILRLHRGKWRRFARRRLRANGSFMVRKKLRGAPGVIRLRARVNGAGSGLSPTIRIKSKARL